MSMTNEEILKVEDLYVTFNTDYGLANAVNGVTFSLKKGETLGIVGESGSGKTVSVLSIVRLLPPIGTSISGKIIYKGKDLLQLSLREMRTIRGSEIGFIYQDPMTSLNPVLTIGYQLTETLRACAKISKQEATEKARELLHLVGITNTKERLSHYPHQLSGGMLQRVMIAIALASNPSLLIADEPTTALDVTIQAQIIELFCQIREEFDLSTIWISHDLGVIGGIADKVIVMYGGRIMEMAETLHLFSKSRHPYTNALFDCIPKLENPFIERLINIPGSPPNPYEASVGCPFAPRCERVMDICRQEMPPLEVVEDNHAVACWVV